MNNSVEKEGLSSQLWLYLDTVIIDFDNYDNTVDLLNAAVNVFLGDGAEETA